MRHATIAAIAILGAIVAPAGADQITTKGMPPLEARVTDVGGGTVSYDRRGKLYRKPVDGIEEMKVSVLPNFSKAEALMKAGKAAEAVAAYDKANTGADSPDWAKLLVHYRRLRAAKAAGMIGPAVADWLVVVKDCSGSDASIAMIPAVPARKGAKGSTDAIELLERQLKGDNGPGLKLAMTSLLEGLYRVEGKAGKASAPQGGGNGGEPAPAANGGPRPPVGPPSEIRISVASGGGQLREAAAQINAGQYVTAAKMIEQRLRGFGTQELPAALLLRGKALLLAYEKGAARNRETLLAAGLSFMRVTACMGGSAAETPEALFYAAKVCEHLGNGVAAGNAYRQILSYHGSSEWAEKARAAMPRR